MTPNFLPINLYPYWIASGYKACVHPEQVEVQDKVLELAINRVKRELKWVEYPDPERVLMLKDVLRILQTTNFETGVFK